MALNSDHEDHGGQYTGLVLEANGIKEHENGEGHTGRWAGVGFVPDVEDITGVSFAKVVGGEDMPAGFGDSLTKLDRLEPDVE